MLPSMKEILLSCKFNHKNQNEIIKIANRPNFGSHWCVGLNLLLGA